MQVSLLIVDGIATNRVALKVKLAAAWYDVSTATTGAEALDLIASQRPNLVLINDTLNDMSIEDIDTELTLRMGRDAPPLLAMSEGTPNRAALLRTGVEDILQLPIDDRFLVSRIRSVLRANAAESEWRLRDGTSRALGFAEPVQQFDRPAPTMLLTGQDDLSQTLRHYLVGRSGMALAICPFSQAMNTLGQDEAPSVILLPMPETTSDMGLNLLSDLRANPVTRHTAILAVAPIGRSDLAAQALDLGADDVAVLPTPRSPLSAKEQQSVFSALSDELAVRANRLHTRHKIKQSLRTAVRNSAEAALRDPLTGLYNRRYALPHLERIAEQAALSGRPFAVMIADLDHFKRINDTYGHDVGDTVLSECARRLQENMRSVDLVARIGGEEFLIVLPATNQHNARRAATRLCEEISASPIRVLDTNMTIPITISIGLAMSHARRTPAETNEDLAERPASMMTRADKALYEAKECGRNRFMLSRPAA